MGFILWLVAFAIAVVVSLVSAFWALGASFGPDIGFAGGGIWFLFLPGAAVGLVVALLLARRLPFPRTMFVVLTAVFSAMGGAVPKSLWKWEIEREQHTTLVYVPAPDYTASLEINLPTEALVGQRIPAKAVYRDGPWKQVTMAEYLRDAKTVYGRFGNASRSMEPPAVNDRIANSLAWQPHDAITKDADTPEGDLFLTFRSPGTHEVYGQWNEALLVKSNVVRITVRAPEFVYVPAPGYSVTLDVSGASETVMYATYAPTATVTHGPWEKIRYTDLKDERYRKYAVAYVLEPPPTPDTELARKVYWFAKPEAALDRQFGAVPAIRFMAPGDHEVTAALTLPGGQRVDSKALKVVVGEKK